MKLKLKGKRPTPATLISVLALFVSLGSSATAAFVVTGANIQDESITSADLRDGGVKARDLDENAAVAKRKRRAKGKRRAKTLVGPGGEQGATGSQGEQGVQGPAGADGTPGPKGPSCVEELSLEECRGEQGSPGPQGEPGQSCVEEYGEAWCKGPPGKNGTNGAPGPNSVRLVTEVALNADNPCVAGNKYNPGSPIKITKSGPAQCRITLLPSQDKKEMAANANTKLGTATLTKPEPATPGAGGGGAAYRPLDSLELLGVGQATQAADGQQAGASAPPWLVDGTPAIQSAGEKPKVVGRGAALESLSERPNLIDQEQATERIGSQLPWLVNGVVAFQPIEENPELGGGDRALQPVGSDKPEPPKVSLPTLVAVTYSAVTVNDGSGRSVEAPSFVVDFYNVLGQPASGSATVTLYTTLST